MRSLFLATTVVIVWPGVLPAADVPAYPRPKLLMEPASLANSQVAEQFVILDVQSKEEYQKEHLPGARWVSPDEWRTAFGDGKDAQGWEKRIGGLGVHSGSKVVVYDDGGVSNAARIWWILRYWGVDDVRLLNGGWKAWKAAGYPTTDEVPPLVKAAQFKAKGRAQRLATKQQVLEDLQANRWQIIDARSENEFCGIDLRGNQRGGAIPGAKHLEWSNLIDQSTHRFKGPEQLCQLFDQAKIDLSRPTASHCQSGGRASVMVFALELMGAKDVRNYYRGWSEWGNAEDTPIVVPESKPNDAKPQKSN